MQVKDSMSWGWKQPMQCTQLSGETSGKAPKERQIGDILPSLLSFPSSNFLPELVTGWLILQEVILNDKVTLRVETRAKNGRADRQMDPGNRRLWSHDTFAGLPDSRIT